MKNLKRIYDTSWESLFNYLIQNEWQKGNMVKVARFSKRAVGVFPFIEEFGEKKKGIIEFYMSDFGPIKFKLDRRLKGDRIYLYGE